MRNYTIQNFSKDKIIFWCQAIIIKEKQKKFSCDYIEKWHVMAEKEEERERAACLRSRYGNWNFLKRHFLHVSQIKSYECSWMLKIIKTARGLWVENGVKHEFHSTYINVYNVHARKGWIDNIKKSLWETKELSFSN